jgi:hypothetical protein
LEFDRMNRIYRMAGGWRNPKRRARRDWGFGIYAVLRGSESGVAGASDEDGGLLAENSHFILNTFMDKYL